MNSFETGLPYLNPVLRQAWGNHLRGESQGSPHHHHPQYQQVTQTPEPLQMGSRDSGCHACGGPSSFSCPFCEKVRYCSHRCQVKRQC